MNLNFMHQWFAGFPDNKFRTKRARDMFFFYMSMMDINSKKADPSFLRICSGLFPILVVLGPPENGQIWIYEWCFASCFCYVTCIELKSLASVIPLLHYMFKLPEWDFHIVFLLQMIKPNHFLEFEFCWSLYVFLIFD